MQATIKYNEGMKFTSRIRDHELVMDVSKPHGKDEGPSPKELLLPSIMGCTAMDVVALLGKWKVKFDSFEMTAEANTTDTQPKVFVQVDLIYDFKAAPDAGAEKFEEAVVQSMTKYCGVSAMITKACPIYYVIRLNGEIESRGQARF